MKYLILGAGGTGGCLGAYLATMCNGSPEADIWKPCGRRG